MKDSPKYCTFCGSKLEMIDRGIVRRGYNAFTGEPNMVHSIIARCPKENKAISEFDSHDVFEIVDNEIT